ncbi:hypothetical protein AB0B25_21835 [Nocardia sp. NPDC049190]|uniref:hypothetical protein n=1 Tax=Nocardia sp. NPDC049190 TaxID=3155650 RepID=UPI0033C5D830
MLGVENIPLAQPIGGYSFAGHSSRDSAANRSVTRDIIFRLAPITKTFAGLTAMPQREHGLIGLDTAANADAPLASRIDPDRLRRGAGRTLFGRDSHAGVMAMHSDVHPLTPRRWWYLLTPRTGRMPP